MDPLVSIIVITYNSKKHILETFESIKEQTYRNIELIVSDDFSTDDTVEVCQNWIRENGDRFIRTRILIPKENTGIPANCNRGIREAQGEWIKLLAGDDLLFPDTIETYVNEIRQDTGRNRQAFHGRVNEFHDSVKPDKPKVDYGDPALQDFNRSDITASEQFNILLRFCPVHATTVLLRRSVFDQVGFFDERFKFWEDRPMWLKMTSNGIGFHFINKELAKYRRHLASVQVNTDKTLFSRALLSKDQGYKAVILPYLPYIERALYRYIFSIRKIFYKLAGNRKTFLINALYKAMIVLPESWLAGIKRHYKP